MPAATNGILTSFAVILYSVKMKKLITCALLMISLFVLYSFNRQSRIIQEDDVINERRNSLYNRTILQLFTTAPINRDFVFHNKLPKCGSTTFSAINEVLKQRNNFTFERVVPTMALFHENQKVVEIVEKLERPLFVIKHHYWFNFTSYNSTQPTFINVIRHPVDWFASRFYFARYGWNNTPACRPFECSSGSDVLHMDIDECVRKRHFKCTEPQIYLKFFCGNNIDCKRSSDPVQNQRTLDVAKRRLLNDFYFVGILEEFEKTLEALETILPEYFDGAREAWKSDYVKEVQRRTKTSYKRPMSEFSRRFLEKTLKYEIKFYNFAKLLFEERLKFLGIN